MGIDKDGVKNEYLYIYNMYCIHHSWKNVGILSTGCRPGEMVKNDAQRLKSTQNWQKQTLKYNEKNWMCSIFWLPSFLSFFPGMIYKHISHCELCNIIIWKKGLKIKIKWCIFGSTWKRSNNVSHIFEHIFIVYISRWAVISTDYVVRL